MINLYDFEKTIYDGNLTIDFYKYCIKKNKKILLNLPFQLINILMYILGIIDEVKYIENHLSYIKKINNIEINVQEFWEKNDKKIKKWYLNQKEKTDIMISEKPELFLKPLEKILKIKVIATKIDKKTGKLEGKYCNKYEKVKRIKEEIKDKKIKSYYTSKKSDKPITEISNNNYFVKKNRIYDIKDDENIKISNYLKIDKMLIVAGILYLVIPILIQLCFWYNRFISIPCIIFLLVSTTYAINRINYLEIDEYKKIFNIRKIIFILLLIITLNMLSGAGGIFSQNWDYHGRNAIFKDLINNSWPVRYNYEAMKYESSVFGNNAILNYYFAYWLPGAIVGKIIGFKLANIFMLIYQIIGTALFFYLIARFMKNNKYRYFFIFIAFGGLNLIGQILMNKYAGNNIAPIGVNHIDTSMMYFCMSSFVTQLFWVFNQSLPAWIAVMLFMQEKEYKSCGYFFALLVPFAPFPMLGFLYLIFAYIIFGKKLDKLINLDRIKELLTIDNILGCMSILPIVFMYTLNESQKGLMFTKIIENESLEYALVSYGLFVLLEFFVYIIMINKKNYKLIIICFLFFTISPIFYIGGSDLGNRATIPLLIVMYLLTIMYLDKINIKSKSIFTKQILLIIILLVAFMTNYNEFYRSINNTYLKHKFNISMLADDYKTFENFEDKECSSFITNFVIKDDKKNKILQFILRK